MTRTILIALTVLIAAASAAEDAPPPRFYIERIEVREAARVSPDVVIAESRLREGQEYTEADLRDAASRLSRLPFLLSSEFALEKGSERGRFVLVVTIAETKPFFYAIDFRPILPADHTVETDYSDRIGAEDGTGALGARWFVGRRGALHLALITTEYDSAFARDYGAVAFGYTQYDLFGTRAFATLSVKQVIEQNAGSISPQLVVGVPLSANQTLTVELDQTRFGDDVANVRNEEFALQRGQRIVGATWSYNTTNRPFLPTRGTLVSVRPRASWSDSATYLYVVSPTNPTQDLEVVADTVHARAAELTVKGAQYWELSERTSVSAGLEGAWTHFQAESDFYGDRSDHVVRVVFRGGYSYSLWDAARMKTGDSRLELNARIGSRSIDYYDLGYTSQQQMSASWVRRSSWGTLRLGVGYAW
ncbi:MAG TPA: hypothetical protein VEK79_14595 [Thermoanaerobaculia bacterium]|nr:hypothetical protein [Thermoanaerobaculia bacterium]